MMSNESNLNFRNDLGEGEYKEKYHRLREQHEIDKRVLLAQFHYQTNTLQQQHQHQLQEHLKMFLAHQKEQQQINQPAISGEDKSLLHTVKAKEKQSAIASNAVKKHLQKFVIDRQKGKGMDAYTNVMQDRSHMYQWAPLLEGNIECRKAPSAIGLSSNKIDDFPLRKTASEPNLKVKSRLKQKLSSDQRCSPLPIRRSEIKTDLANRIKKKLSLDKNENNLDIATSCDLSQKNAKDSSFLMVDPTELHEENVLCDLYTSPSLPNISLALSQKQPDSVIISHRKNDLNRLIGRTTSHPGGGAHVSPKMDYWFCQQGDNGYHSKASLPPGPIRPPQLARPHKALSRTRSAPTTASSQLQHHILQRKQRMLQQQQEQLKKNNSLAKMDVSKLSQFPEDENRVNRATHMQMKTTFEASPFELASNLPTANVYRSVHCAEETPQELPHLANSKVENKQAMYPTHRPLMRTQSSPASSFLKKLDVKKDYRFTTGIAYSPVMLKHGCACGDDHIENSTRIEVVWKRLHKCGLLSESPTTKGECELIDARKATTDELQLVHTQEHTLRYGTTSLARKELDLSSKFIVLPCGGVGVDNGIDIDTVWNELATINAARMAVGCTVDLALLVAEEKIKNGFAVVRPPGHHAQKNLAMAFCYFNSVAVAARKLQRNFSKDYKKILIIDWDVHHCNGTQNIFYADPTVLVISVHRYDDGQFFPGTGSLNEIGTDEGVGFNVNIGFSNSMNPPKGDADYIAVFQTIVMPIAHQFKPDFVFVSSGFSPAGGHPETLGGYKVSPKCFGYLTNQIMQLANGKVVMALEGGFELNALCDCTEVCVKSLLGDKSASSISPSMMVEKPSLSTVKCIEEVISIQAAHWKCLENINIHQSYTDWQLESKENEACDAMASLSVKNHVDLNESSSADLSKPTPSPKLLEISASDKNVTVNLEDSIASDQDMSIGISTLHATSGSDTQEELQLHTVGR